MIRLSHSTLVAALGFVQNLGSAGTLAALRAVIPSGLDRLISSDRVSLNEIDLSRECRSVVPSPVPVWWSRLGELYRNFLHEHPIWDPQRGIKCNQLVTFSDCARDAVWKSSTLYNDYFLNLGVRCQIGVLIHGAGSQRTAVAFNRVRCDFKPKDRLLFGLLAPHITNAYRTVLALDAAERNHQEPFHESFLSSHIIAVKPDGKTICQHSAEALGILREFFYHESGMKAELPEKVYRWLRARKDRMLRGEFTTEPFPPLIANRGMRTLTIRLACLRPEEAVLLLECDRPSETRRCFCAEMLTKREREILRWAGEGKRNAEIGIILGVSLRTVEKHLENIFRKLGVETRTAAIRCLL